MYRILYDIVRTIGGTIIFFLLFTADVKTRRFIVANHTAQMRIENFLTFYTNFLGIRRLGFTWFFCGKVLFKKEAFRERTNYY